MVPLNADAFFYGLFMDAAILEAKGISGSATRGVVRDWALRIGNRATMVPEQGRSVHGVVMSVPLPDLERLYQDVSVQMYRPVAVLVEYDAAPARPALAYVLSVPPQPEERNPDYATKLRALADRIGLPSEYVASIT
jgi:hypothetical protein